MKGYSFKGLVDFVYQVKAIADAAVKRAGDTMTGNLIVDTPNGGISLQGTNLNQTDVTWSRADSTLGHTIRFSEDIEATNFIARAKDSVALRSYITHDHASGETKLYRPRAADPQGTTPESLTRKDYVDTTFVKKAGDTMTGKLTMPSFQAEVGLVFNEDNQLGFNFSSNSAGYAELVRKDAAGDEWNYGLRAYTDADWRIGSQRIYHQGFKPTPADVGAVAKVGDTMTGPLILNEDGGALSLKAPTANASSYVVSNVGGTNHWFMGKGDTNDTISLFSYATSNGVHFHPTYTDLLKDPRSAAAQGTAANSLTRKDYVDAINDIKEISIARPSGALAGYWYPVFLNPGLLGADIKIFTKTAGGADSMNNNSFAGQIRSGGWNDTGDSILGFYQIYASAERAIGSVHVATESTNGVAFYVHENAFPVTVQYHSNQMLSTPKSGTSVSFGASIFAGINNPASVSGSTKTRIALDFSRGGGAYSNMQGLLFGTTRPPTPAEIGVSPFTACTATTIAMATNYTADVTYFVALKMRCTSDDEITQVTMDGKIVCEMMSATSDGDDLDDAYYTLNFIVPKGKVWKVTVTNGTEVSVRSCHIWR